MQEHRRYCSQLFVLLVLFIISLYVVPISGNNGSGLIEVDVGVILDADDPMVGKVSQTCISMALEDFYALNQNHNTTRIVLHKRDSKGDVVEAASAGDVRTQAMSFRSLKCILLRRIGFQNVDVAQQLINDVKIECALWVKLLFSGCCTSY
ncbi:hypothetical protein RHSIM_Rhsim08G0247600 [Rhododendron simsii]|uniref:Uncharacterized protein n=1 Tax=Rhododendron simsii TaxID=118357 RepID=A0A834LHH8_RHOSS|nr:hypothetical protein RHSIM_Rhsim08G0247600 [Rhododendron simsii]